MTRTVLSPRQGLQLPNALVWPVGCPACTRFSARWRALSACSIVNFSLAIRCFPPARRRALPAPCNASAGCATATAPATASYQQSLLVCQVSWCSCPCAGRTRPGRRACAMRKVCTHPLCATGNVPGHTTPAVSDVGGASVRLKFRADTGRSRDAGDIEAGGWLLALSRRGGAAHGGVLPAIAAVPGENGMDRFMQSRQGLAECVVMARPILCPQVSVIASSPHTGC